MKIKSASDLKYYYETLNPNGRFFTRNNMRFLGDTMRNYGISDLGGYYELRRKKPVKHGIQVPHYFVLRHGKLVETTSRGTACQWAFEETSELGNRA